MRYPHVDNVCGKQAYSPFCLCRYCSNHSFWTGLSAMSDKQILERVKGRKMNKDQRKLIRAARERVKLRVWNEWAKGEAS